MTIKALLDTGNCLYEPLTGKPVCLVEYGRLKTCLKNGTVIPGIRAIPYHSIGKKHGVLLGVNQGRKYEQSGCIVGIYKGKLSQSGEFSAIVHPDILKK